VFFTVERFPEVFWPKTMRYYSSIGYALSSFHPALETLIDFFLAFAVAGLHGVLTNQQGF